MDNSKKKWQFIQLYNWVIKNRPMDDDKPWEHLYDLNYMRFPVDDKFSYSSFGKRVYLLTWGFIISLAVWYTIDGWKKTGESGTKPEQNEINKRDSIPKGSK